MTLIDAYGLVAFVADEAAADEVEALLRQGDCRVAAANLAEAVDICQRTHKLPLANIRAALDPLILSSTIEVAVSNESHAWLAADLRGRYYHRKERPLSLADSLLLAHALLGRDSLATADPSIAEVARAEGLDLIPLPDRSGRRP